MHISKVKLQLLQLFASKTKFKNQAFLPPSIFEYTIFKNLIIAEFPTDHVI